MRHIEKTRCFKRHDYRKRGEMKNYTDAIDLVNMLDEYRTKSRLFENAFESALNENERLKKQLDHISKTLKNFNAAVSNRYGELNRLQEEIESAEK